MSMSPKTVDFWLRTSRHLSIVGYVLTLFSNVLLIILTGWYIKRKFGTYKYLIIIFSTVGLIFDTLDFILNPMLQSFANGFILFTTIGSFTLSQQALTCLLAIYGGLYHVSNALLAVMFIHRYFSVAKPEQLFYFQEKRITLWLTYSFLIGGMNGSSCLYCGKIDEYSKSYMFEEIFNTYREVMGDFPAMALIVYDNCSNIRWCDVFVIAYSSLSVLVQNAIIVYCGYKIRKKLYSKNTNYSASLRKLHSQFFKTLIFQVATPTILLFIPTTLILYLPLIGFDIHFPSGIVFALFGLYPAIDSCLVMYIITDYSNAMRDLAADVRKLFGINEQKN